MNFLSEKTKLRSIFLKKRKKIRTVEKNTNLLNSKLQDFLKSKKNVISGYYAINGELDILSTLFFLIEEGKEVCLPEIEKKNEALKFRKFEKKSKLIKSYFNTYIPSPKKNIIPEILLIPMLAFNNLKYRLGYGGGYYDRTIEDLEKSRKILTVGVAYDEQLSDSLPCEKHDKILDVIFTPTRIFR